MPPKTNEVLVIDDQPQAMAKHDDRMSGDPMALLRLAIERGSDVGAIERLMAVRQQLNSEHAKAEYDRAMADFQRECPVIEKNKAGAKGAYKYAPLDAIVSQVKELIHRHGFSFGVTSEIKPGFLKAICKITHSAGHSEPSVFEIPIDNKNPMMTDPQRYGGAMTFAKRYAFCNGFGILTADEDIDGAGKRPKPPGPSSNFGDKTPTKSDMENKKRLVEITRKIHQCNGYSLDDLGKQQLSQWLIDENMMEQTDTIAELTGAKLAAVVAKVEKKVGAK